MTQIQIKKYFTYISSSIVLLSCQNSLLKDNSANNKNQSSASSYHQLIKSDKKKQADLDLPYRGFDPEKNISVIAIGSVINQDLPQPIWQTVEKNNPNLFILSGNGLTFKKADQKTISDQYKKMKTVSEFRSIREKVPFMAIWDDQDFALNDGGSDNSIKEIARTEFIKNWSYLKLQLPNNQKALYHSKIFGTKKQTVQVIMLDTRWDRSPLLKKVDMPAPAPETNPALATNVSAPVAIDKLPQINSSPVGPYLPDLDKSKQILSKEQWNWLDQELKKPVSLRLIVSPIQVIAEDHNFEKWGNFPNEKEKLFELLQKNKIKNAVFISGNRELSAISKIDLKKLGTVYELTASGLNLIPEAISEKEMNSQMAKTDKSYLSDAFTDSNFGLISIQWEKRLVSLQVKSLTNEVKSSTDFKF